MTEYPVRVNGWRQTQSSRETDEGATWQDPATAGLPTSAQRLVLVRRPDRGGYPDRWRACVLDRAEGERETLYLGESEPAARDAAVEWLRERESDAPTGQTWLGVFGP